MIWGYPYLRTPPNDGNWIVVTCGNDPQMDELLSASAVAGFKTDGQTFEAAEL